MSGRDDTGLTPVGQQQCQQLGSWLHRHGYRPDHIYSSPLPRALQSLEGLLSPWQWLWPQNLTIAPHLKSVPGHELVAVQTAPLQTAGPQPSPTLTLCPRLQEFDAGILTGLTWAEAKARFPDLCEQLETTLEWRPIPEAETPQQGRNRAQQFISQLLTQHTNQDQVWVMSHQWILEHLMACLLGSDRTWQLPMPNTALFEFWLDRDRWSAGAVERTVSNHWQIKRFGDRPHLADSDQP